MKIKKFIKRSMDVVFSAGALTVLALPLAALFAAVRIQMGGSAIFSQERVGQDKKLFMLYKLGSMSNARGPDGKLLPDAERVSDLGRFMRKRGIDEFLQFWNVLKGDMSIVGPRPVPVMESCWRFDPVSSPVHNVKPGLVGAFVVARATRQHELDDEERKNLEEGYAADPVNLSRDFMLMVRLVVPLLARGNGKKPQGVDPKSPQLVY